jgi:hypothetical protein
MVTDIQNLVIDKASRLIDVINIHLDETPSCRHTLGEILDDIEKLKIDESSHWAYTQQQKSTQQPN